MDPLDYVIDEMNPSDWPQVERIYGEGIRTGLATFEASVPTYEKWDQNHIRSCRLVARCGDTVLGWAVLSPVSSRCCYQGVAEHSIYISEDARGRGVGTKLLHALIEKSEEQGFWTIQSGITKENSSSRALHVKCGFRELGIREKIAQMPDGQWHDVVLVERRSKTVGV